MKTYVVNLEQSVDRRAAMEEQLARFPQLEAEFVPAVDGRKMSEEEVLGAFDRERAKAYYGRDLTRGEIGCTLSHVRCYNRIAEAADNAALILEDDADLGTQLPDFARSKPSCPGRGGRRLCCFPGIIGIGRASAGG